MTNSAQIHTVNTWSCCWNDPSENHPGLMLLYPLTCSDETPLHHLTTRQSRAHILTSVWQKEKQTFSNNRHKHIPAWGPNAVCLVPPYGQTLSHMNSGLENYSCFSVCSLEIDLSMTQKWHANRNYIYWIASWGPITQHVWLKAAIDTSDPGCRFTCRNLKHICEVAFDINTSRNFSTIKNLVTVRLHIFVV